MDRFGKSIQPHIPGIYKSLRVNVIEAREINGMFLAGEKDMASLQRLHEFDLQRLKR
jgi:hypothetical protein